METTEHQPDQPTPLPSDTPAEGDAREGDDEHDEDGG